MGEVIVNRVAESGLITLDLEDLLPSKEIVDFDLAPHLFMGQVLKEKDFRAAMQSIDWQMYSGKLVALNCSVDAIIPAWAYMLVTTYLQPFANEVLLGNKDAIRNQVLIRNIQQLDSAIYTDKRVVVKGCGNIPIGDIAYVEITKKLRPIVKSLMYGEPCSTVPLYKKVNEK